MQVVAKVFSEIIIFTLKGLGTFYLTCQGLFEPNQVNRLPWNDEKLEEQQEVKCHWRGGTTSLQGLEPLFCFEERHSALWIAGCDLSVHFGI